MPLSAQVRAALLAANTTISQSINAISMEQTKLRMLLTFEQGITSQSELMAVVNAAKAAALPHAQALVTLFT